MRYTPYQVRPEPYPQARPPYPLRHNVPKKIREIKEERQEDNNTLKRETPLTP
jgi:hypothetical protein